MVKHLTSQDNILTEGRSECRKGPSESVNLAETCSRQTMIIKASAQTGATMFSEEKSKQTTNEKKHSSNHQFNQPPKTPYATATRFAGRLSVIVKVLT
jgi:hypothetical protein